MLTDRSARQSLGTAAFAAVLDAALGHYKDAASFLSLLLVDVDGATEIDIRDRTLGRVADVQSADVAIGRLDDGCLAVLVRAVLTPAEAMDRCDGVLNTVRAVSRASLADVLTVSVGLALAPGRRRGSAALLAEASRAMRRAASEGGDRWAAA